MFLVQSKWTWQMAMELLEGQLLTSGIVLSSVGAVQMEKQFF